MLSTSALLSFPCNNFLKFCILAAYPSFVDAEWHQPHCHGINLNEYDSRLCAPWTVGASFSQMDMCLWGLQPCSSCCCHVRCKRATASCRHCCLHVWGCSSATKVSVPNSLKTCDLEAHWCLVVLQWSLTLLCYNKNFITDVFVKLSFNWIWVLTAYSLFHYS